MSGIGGGGGGSGGSGGAPGGGSSGIGGGNAPGAPGAGYGGKSAPGKGSGASEQPQIGPDGPGPLIGPHPGSPKGATGDNQQQQQQWHSGNSQQQWGSGKGDLPKPSEHGKGKPIQHDGPGGAWPPVHQTNEQ